MLKPKKQKSSTSVADSTGNDAVRHILSQRSNEPVSGLGLGMAAYNLLKSQKQAKQAKQLKTNAENELKNLQKGFPDTFKKKMR